MLKKLISAACSILMLITSAATAMAEPLAGTRWRFVDLNGRLVPPTVQTSINFMVDGGTSGNSGCNGFSGEYVSHSTDLTFSNLGWTKMFCNDSNKMGVEVTIQGKLKDTRFFKIAGSTLYFIGTEDRVLARLAAVPSD
jgi:heat shock protein HslJ